MAASKDSLNCNFFSSVPPLYWRWDWGEVSPEMALAYAESTKVEGRVWTHGKELG